MLHYLRISDEPIDVSEMYKQLVAHRTGELTLTDIAVFVGVAAPHRAEAFKWCQHVIDTLKHEVPIWKKEYDTDKVRWGN